MKLRHLAHLLGLKARPQTYGYEVRSFALPRDGAVSWAQWLHPSEAPKEVTQESVDALRTFLREGDVAIDIGAHSGDTAVPMALAVGRQGAVLAFEPNRFVFPVLEKNASLNGDRTRIFAHPYAVTPEDGKLVFEYSDAGFCNGGLHEGMSVLRHGHVFKLEVEGVNLAAFLARRHAELVGRIRYVKVDTEGFDRAVIESMSELLRRTRPYLRSEFFKRLSHAQRVAQLRAITSLGYRVQRAVSETELRGEDVTESNVSRWDHFDVFCTPT